MPYSELDAIILRDALKDEANITEKKMFGGLCFFLNGNMLCGVHKTGAMFRVGKENEAKALSIKAISPLQFTGRKMGGFVQSDHAFLDNKKERVQILNLALDYINTLPAKPKKQQN